MDTIVVARFTVQGIKSGMYGHPIYENGEYVRSEQQELRTIRMAPVYSNDPDDPNKKYWDATPSGEFQLGTVNEKAWSAFEEGDLVEIQMRVIKRGA